MMKLKIYVSDTLDEFVKSLLIDPKYNDSIEFVSKESEASLVINTDFPEKDYDSYYILIWDTHLMPDIENYMTTAKSIEEKIKKINRLMGIYTKKELESSRKEEFIGLISYIFDEINRKVQIEKRIKKITEFHAFQEVGSVVHVSSEANLEGKFTALFLDKPMLDLLKKISSKILSNEKNFNELKRIAEYYKNKLYDESRKKFNYENIKKLSDSYKDKIIRIDPILLLGETGVGKTLIAKWLYDFCSNYITGNFIEINASGLSKETLESELFGHVKGSFTGAEQDKPGHVLNALGGILFIDEIGDLPLELQPRIMKYIEEFRFKPVGWYKDYDIYCPALIVLATNKNLEEEVKKGNFRRDFYGRLRFRVEIPSIKERINSISAIVDVILQYSENKQRGVKYISYECLEELKQLEYKENFRELERLISCLSERAKYYDTMMIISDFLEHCNEQSKKGDL